MATRNDNRQSAIDDADDMIRYFQDQIADQLIESGEASDDFNNDYVDGDSYHHETHVDRAYRLTEAAELLEELSDYEETDSGLWEGLSPREAISAQAAYTYGNAVSSFWAERIEEINDDDEIRESIEEYNTIEDPTEEQTAKIRATIIGRIGAILA